MHAFVAKLGRRCFWWFPSAMTVPIQVGISMASLYKFLYIWVKHFFGYLAYEIFLSPKFCWGSLYIYLLSFPGFWTFIYWTVLIFILIYFEWGDTENQQLLASYFRFFLIFEKNICISDLLTIFVCDICYNARKVNSFTHKGQFNKSGNFSISQKIWLFQRSQREVTYFYIFTEVKHVPLTEYCFHKLNEKQI